MSLRITRRKQLDYTYADMWRDLAIPVIIAVTGAIAWLSIAAAEARAFNRQFGTDKTTLDALWGLDWSQGK